MGRRRAGSHILDGVSAIPQTQMDAAEESASPFAYLRVCDRLIADMAGGGLRAGVRLPSERTLAEASSVARTTVRQAILHLEREGCIIRTRRGRRGWFVAPPPLRYDPTRHRNFYGNAEAQGRRPGSILLRRIEVAADAELGHVFSVDAGTRLFAMDSISTLEERKICVERNWLLPDTCPDFLERRFYHSLTSFMEQEYGLYVTQTGFQARAASFSHPQAIALDVTPDTPGLRIRRVKVDPAGRVVQVGDERWIASAMEIVVGNPLDSIDIT